MGTRVRAVFDTNLLADLLEGVDEAVIEFERYDDPSVSIVSWIELMVGARIMGIEARARRLLDRFDLRSLTPEVAEQATAIRIERRIKLPDAVIWGTARAMNCILVTRDTTDFPADDPGIRVPYQR